jgi:DNA polymerase-3 subunit alpha
MVLTGQYTVYHLHSDLSNGVTNIDSVTKYAEYIQRARECGMTAMGFSEHGSVFEWYHKKRDIEAAGMKYLHGVEAYLTSQLAYKERDNYHCVLIARNYDGVLELNRLVSNSFCRTDNHFYYTPRISFEELFHTSDNILVTTACVGGVLGKTEDPYIEQLFLDFLKRNRHRCFLEIGHHLDEKQKQYNRKLLALHESTGIPLIAGTDTHVLNEEHEQGRVILQRAKNIRFDSEENWDLKFKTYDELVEAYRQQAVLPEAVFLEAIENTNRLADLVEPFTMDRGTKYPHIYDDPEKTFRDQIQQAMRTHPYALRNHTEAELQAVIDEEFAVYKATGSIDFMLLQTYLRTWEKQHGIQCGYGRGSVSGSMIAYLLGITQMDSLRFDLNFFRFMNPSRVTNADIDSDYSGRDRDAVKQFLLRDKLDLPNIRSAEIITFNTIATKGAIREVCRALYKPDKNAPLSVPQVDYMQRINEICAAAEADETAARQKYPEVFHYVDIISGTIVSIGTHPSGVLLSDLPIDEMVGMCSTSTSPYPVSMLNMKELDDLMYVKLDILGLDNIGVINDTCQMLGIERLTPDNTDLEDMAVWQSIREDTTLIFQWESNSAQRYLRQFMSDRTLEIARSRVPNFSMLKWMSFGNGLIRPACASFRDSVAKGEFYDNGFDALNDFLAPEAGRIAMQETIMRFLVAFCGYSQAESDTVRRAIAKKKGTETLLPEIEQRFIAYSSQKYGMTTQRCEEVIKPFLQIILDASDYGFSWNHSDAYSAIGYICGYLRYYHPLEFLTAALNIFEDNAEKTAAITQYAKKVGIAVTLPKWGISRATYSCDAASHTIAKGLSSVKYMSADVASELASLYPLHYASFMDLLRDLREKTSIDTRQLDILIKLDFFSMFGNQRELFAMVDLFEKFKEGNAKQVKKIEIDGTQLEPIVQRHAVGTTKSGGVAKSYTLLDVMAILRESEVLVRSAGLEDLSLTMKAKNFIDIMGYAGYVSGDPNDRRTLYVTEVKPTRRKSDGVQFGYGVFTRSLGSGKEARFTVFNKVYKKDPIKTGDVIRCLGYHREGTFFTLTAYKHVY